MGSDIKPAKGPLGRPPGGGRAEKGGGVADNKGFHGGALYLELVVGAPSIGCRCLTTSLEMQCPDPQGVPATMVCSLAGREEERPSEGGGRGGALCLEEIWYRGPQFS